MHIDTSDDSFILFRRAMKSVSRLSKTRSEASVRGDWMDRPTRPASSVFHDRLKRSIAVREITTSKLAKAVAPAVLVPRE